MIAQKESTTRHANQAFIFTTILLTNDLNTLYTNYTVTAGTEAKPIQVQVQTYIKPY